MLVRPHKATNRRSLAIGHTSFGDIRGPHYGMSMALMGIRRIGQRVESGIGLSIDEAKVEGCVREGQLLAL